MKEPGFQRHRQTPEAALLTTYYTALSLQRPPRQAIGQAASKSLTHKRSEPCLSPCEVQMWHFPLAAVTVWVRRAERHPGVTRIAFHHHQGCINSQGHGRGQGWDQESTSHGQGPVTNSQRPTAPSQVSGHLGKSEGSDAESSYKQAGLEENRVSKLEECFRGRSTLSLSFSNEWNEAQIEWSSVFQITQLVHGECEAQNEGFFPGETERTWGQVLKEAFFVWPL